MYIRIYIRMYISVHVRMHACLSVCLYVHYVCVYVFVHTNVIQLYTLHMSHRDTTVNEPIIEEGWNIVCSTSEEWREFIEPLKSVKSGPEKHLCRLLEQEFLPEIEEIIIERVRR